MIKSIFNTEFVNFFNNSPTPDQQKAMDVMNDFLFNAPHHSLFVLRGYAGTGKTTMMAAVVKALQAVNINCVLLAPTGRAAKVFSRYAGHQAFTIHKMIFRQQNLDFDAAFSLGFNAMNNVLFIVDEASMISDQPNEMNLQESLLDSLVSFVYGNKRGCRLILMGDTAQLPPVGEDNSPALNKLVLGKFGLDIYQAELKNVVRQNELTGILWNATNIRTIIERQLFGNLPKIRFDGFADVRNVPGDMLIETLTDCYQHDGMEETMVVCRSNKRANIYNNGIRNQILFREGELESGDMVMIAKNNYFWTKPSNSGDKEEQMANQPEFVANGDIAQVQRVRNVRELFGFHFADCTLSFPDYEGFELDATVLLDTLQSPAPALTHEQNERLFNNVMEDYLDISQKRERLKKMKEDPYFNALQIKYAYAVTCHKAQGGQWTDIFVDQGFVPEDTSVKEYCRWLYTAVTRATQRLFFVNWKEEQILDAGNFDNS